jgi:hypothetical protein
MRGERDGKPYWVCYPCQHFFNAAPTHQPKLPLQPGPQKRRINRKEADVQREIATVLRQRGYEVMVTSRVMKVAICQRCGEKNWPRGGDGVSKGLGDILVWHPKWPRFFRVEADVKGPRTPLSPEQKLRVEAGVLVIWRSVEDALKECEKVDARAKEWFLAEEWVRACGFPAEWT